MKQFGIATCFWDGGGGSSGIQYQLGHDSCFIPERVDTSDLKTIENYKEKWHKIQQRHREFNKYIQSKYSDWNENLKLIEELKIPYEQYEILVSKYNPYTTLERKLPWIDSKHFKNFILDLANVCNNYYKENKLKLHASVDTYGKFSIDELN